MIVKFDDRTYTVWIHFWTLFLLPGYRTGYPLVCYRETPVQFISDIEQNVHGILRPGMLMDFSLGFHTRNLLGFT